MKRLFLSFVLSSSAPLMVELKECIFLIKGVGTRSRVICLLVCWQMSENAVWGGDTKEHAYLKNINLMYNLYSLRKKELVKTYLIFLVVYSAAIIKAVQIRKKYYKKEEWRSLFTHNLFFPDTTAW